MWARPPAPVKRAGIHAVVSRIKNEEKGFRVKMKKVEEKPKELKCLE